MDSHKCICLWIYNNDKLNRNILALLPFINLALSFATSDDDMSVLSYAKYEIELGNSKYMQNVYKDAKERYINLIYMMKDLQIDKSRDMVKFTIDFLKK